MNGMCKQSYTIAWQKVAIGHCEFSVLPLHLIFKIRYHSAKTRLIGEVLYELKTK